MAAESELRERRDGMMAQKKITKFKVGDRVRVLDSDYRGPIVRGLGGTVIKVGVDDVDVDVVHQIKLDIDYTNLDNVNSWNFFQSWLEPEGEGK